MAPPKKMTKVVTENEIESGRISLPATVRDDLFPHVTENSKTAATMVDEKGDSYEVVLKVRHNRTKPEIMAKGGKKFAQNRKLKPGDVLVFSTGQSGDHFEVRVKRGPRLGGFSASMETVGPLAGSQPTLSPYLIGSDDHATMVLMSSSVDRIKAEVQEEGVGPTLELTLGLGLGPPPIVEPQEAKSKPPEGIWVAEQDLQEPKPPTLLTPFWGVFLSLQPPLNPRPEEGAAPLAADQHANVAAADGAWAGSGML